MRSAEPRKASQALSPTAADSPSISILVSPATTVPRVTATSAASATLSGEAGDIEITVSSAAKVDAMDLNARNADVSASSGGSIKITCMKSIDASASSGGSVKYAAKGDLDPELRHTSSGGSVKKL